VNIRVPVELGAISPYPKVRLVQESTRKGRNGTNCFNGEYGKVKGVNEWDIQHARLYERAKRDIAEEHDDDDEQGTLFMCKAASYDRS